VPASTAQAVAQRERESQAHQEKMAQVEAGAMAQAEAKEQARRATVTKLLAVKPPFNKRDPVIRGDRISRLLQGKNTSGKHRLTLDQLLALKPIGEQGDLATFEIPANFDALTNLANYEVVTNLRALGGRFLPKAELYLLVDDEMRGACARATNGYCLLVWNTAYDPPGQHALQAQLRWYGRGDLLEVTGPVMPFYSTNVVQFFGPSFFDDKGTTLYAKLRHNDQRHH
jgi:hypothetical protein